MYIVFLFLIIILYFHPVLLSNNVFIERDLYVFFIPPKYLWVNIAKNFELPLWNPHNYSGIPLLATLQPGVFYPPQIIYLFLPFNVAWNWLIFLHFVFAGFSTYLLLRYLRASKLASFVGGIVFMMSGYMLSVHNLLPHLFSVPWFPLVIKSFLTYFNTNRTKHLVYTALFLSMELLAGAPEIVMMTALVLFVLLFFLGILSDSACVPKSTEVGYHAESRLPIVAKNSMIRQFYNGIVLRQITHRFWILCIVIALFLLISAMQLLPFLELKSQSIRSNGLEYSEATTWSFAWKDFIQFFLPDSFGYFKTKEKYWSNQSWLKTVYLGIIPFMLSVYYFIMKDRRKWIFLILILLSFIFGLGNNTPFYKLLHLVPPFNSIRYPVKFLFLFFFTIAITSGIGFDKLIRGVENKEPLTIKTIQIFFYIGFIFVLLWGYINVFATDVCKFLDLHGFKPEAYNTIPFNIHNAKRFLFFSFLFSISLLVYLRSRRRYLISLFLVLLLGADLFLANYGYYYSVSWNKYISKQAFESELFNNNGADRYFATRKTERDFENLPGESLLINPYASLLGLYTIDGSEVMRIRHHEAFLSIMYGTSSISNAKKYFDMSGVRHIITSYKVDDDDLKLVKSMNVADKTAYLYEYTKYPGRFLLFSKVSFAKDDREVIEKLQSNAFDSRSELILLQPPGVNSSSPSPRPSPARGEGTQEVNSSSPSPRPSPARGEGKWLPSRKGSGNNVTAYDQNRGVSSSNEGNHRAGSSNANRFDAAKNKDVQGRVKLLSYKANRFSLEYESDGDAFLYVSDTYYPGWRAYVDGKETQIYRANLAFRAIAAPKGKHTVVFKYVPMSFYAGLVLTIIGILLCIWLWRRDRKAAHG